MSWTEWQEDVLGNWCAVLIDAWIKPQSVQLPTVEFGTIQDGCWSRRCLVHSWRGRADGRRCHSTALGCWRLDRIPALRLAELAHAKRVKLCVQECVGVRQNVGMFGTWSNSAQFLCYVHVLGWPDQTPRMSHLDVFRASFFLGRCQWRATLNYHDRLT